MTYLADIYCLRDSLRRQLDALQQDIVHSQDCCCEPEEELVLAAKACGDEWQSAQDRIDRVEAFENRSSIEFPDAFINDGPWDIDAPIRQLDVGFLGEIVHVFHQNPSGLSAAVREGRAHLNLTIQFPANTLMIAVDSADPQLPSGPWMTWSEADGWRSA